MAIEGLDILEHELLLGNFSYLKIVPQTEGFSVELAPGKKGYSICEGGYTIQGTLERLSYKLDDKPDFEVVLDIVDHLVDNGYELRVSKVDGRRLVRLVRGSREDMEHDTNVKMAIDNLVRRFTVE